MAIQCWMDKQNVVYPYNGILFSHKIGMEFWYMKGQIFWFYLYEMSRVGWLSGAVGEKEWGVIANGNGVSFWGDEMFWNWMVIILSKYIKTLSFTLFSFFLAVPLGKQELVPQSGIKPVPTVVEAQSPNHWTARKFQDFLNSEILFFNKKLIEIIT